MDDTNTFPIDTNILVLDLHAPSPPTTIPAPFETMDLSSPCSSQHLHKPTRLPDFVYYSYANSFASFLAFIHNLYKSLSYREAIL